MYRGEPHMLLPGVVGATDGGMWRIGGCPAGGEEKKMVCRPTFGTLEADSVPDGGRLFIWPIHGRATTTPRHGHERSRPFSGALSSRPSRSGRRGNTPAHGASDTNSSRWSYRSIPYS